MNKIEYMRKWLKTRLEVEQMSGTPEGCAIITGIIQHYDQILPQSTIEEEQEVKQSSDDAYEEMLRYENEYPEHIDEEKPPLTEMWIGKR